MYIYIYILWMIYAYLHKTKLLKKRIWCLMIVEIPF